MLDDRKWKLATAQFHAIRTNIPTLIHENLVIEYHEALTAMASASGEDFDSFRIPQSEIKPRVTGGQVGFGGNPGRTFYSKDNFCDVNLFKRKIDSLFRYLPALDDAQANQDSNAPQSIRAQTQKRYREIQAAQPPVQHHTVHVENMIGSVIQQGTSGSTATVNFSTTDLKTLLDKIRAALPTSPLRTKKNAKLN